MFASVPSQKALIAVFGDDPGRKVRALLTAKADPDDYPSVAAWVERCYHPPSRIERVTRCTAASRSRPTSPIRLARAVCAPEWWADAATACRWGHCDHCGTQRPYATDDRDARLAARREKLTCPNCRSASMHF